MKRAGQEGYAGGRLHQWSSGALPLVTAGALTFAIFVWVSPWAAAWGALSDQPHVLAGSIRAERSADYALQFHRLPAQQPPVVFSQFWRSWEAVSGAAPSERPTAVEVAGVSAQDLQAQ